MGSGPILWGFCQGFQSINWVKLETFKFGGFERTKGDVSFFLTHLKFVSMVNSMEVGIQILGMAVAVVFLGKGADLFVDGAAQIARKMNISELVIGLTLVGFGTSAPEFAVSIGAALTGRPDMSVGNIVGSNIFNLGFILGGCAAIAPIACSKQLVFRDGFFLIAVTSLLAFFIGDLQLERWEGIVMMALLVCYLVLLFFKGGDVEEHAQDHDISKWCVPLGFAGLLMVLGGAHLLVECASGIARAYGMSEWAIGVTIVAAGTSAPEMVTCLAAALKGKHGISAGTLIGSDLYNLLGVLGLAAFITPMSVSPTGKVSVFILVGMVLMVVAFMRTGWKISRAEGIFLVSLNLVRWLGDMGVINF